jgi:tetratricopeptide (TPR) repeat protein
MTLALLILLAVDFTTVERLIGAGDFRGALAALQRAPERASARWHLLASKAYDGLDDPKRAVEEAEAALAIDYRNEAIHLQLAQIFLTRNTPEPAYEILSEARRLFPDSLMIRLGRGLAAKESERYDEALADLSECLRRRPDWGLALDALGAVYLHLNRASELAKVAAAHCDRNPRDFRGWYYLAEARSALGMQDGESERLVTRSIQLNPNFAASHALLAKMLADRGDTAGAIRELEQAVKLRPDHRPWHVRLANAYRDADRAADAERELAVARRLEDQERRPVPVLKYHRGKKQP